VTRGATDVAAGHETISQHHVHESALASVFTEQHDPTIEVIAVEEAFKLDLTELSEVGPRETLPLT
jgi:hypothetical protein